jgi:hypothetical protein
MTAPAQYLRDLREQRESRRLGVVKALRDTPTATNIELSKVFGVSRNTIAEDRQAIMEQLTQSTLSETEQLRAAMVTRLEKLDGEIERHRLQDGRLPMSLIHEMHLVTRSLIELLGVRKPVTEKLEIRKRTISFSTSIVGPDQSGTEPKVFALTTEQLALGEGEGDE